MKKITKLLVANRGEIAIRVFRAASELSIRTVAIYTYEDRYSLHRYKADEAYQVGKNEDPLKPYLDIEEIIHIAKQQGVDAIHPGYGFLSENVNFVRRCREEGIIFVGPSPEVMEQLGDKVKAKVIAEKAQVPIIQSNQEPLTNVEQAVEMAHQIGYPIMVKAAAGGGGRGMRVVRGDDELSKAFIEARREAKNAFGDDTIFLEKFIENPKHIEVQILGDQQGNIIHLFERDCSVQRRFQKVVEVAPSFSLRSETKTALHSYALRIARTVGYYNAGTVEFLVDQAENIYFIEVNPRIQVEHTVTEEVTGVDLVRSQILIADGTSLAELGIADQTKVVCEGFAVQCRITTENPKEDFKPDYGKIIAYRNATGFGIRLDEGSVYSGATVSPFFDSMLVKVTAWGRTLEGAASRLYRALTEFRIRGVKTNTQFLGNVLRNDTFLSGNATVGFIQNNPELFDFYNRRDRATKVLRYLANVTVNGNPNVKFKEETKQFNTPVIPDYDRFKPYCSGTKQILDNVGPEKFSQWLKDQKAIQITDTTFRDAHQSLLATRMRPKDMLAVAESFVKNHPQIFSMEVWGGATFDVSMRFLHESPWKRLALFREAMPNTLLQMLLRGSNAVGYTAYPDNLVERFIEESWKTGVDIFRIFDSLNWIENMRISINAVRERTGGLAEACLCYTGDVFNPNEQKYSLQYYIDLAKQLEDAGAHIIAIKDMAGLLKPYAAEKLVKALKESIDLPIHLHTHDTSSAQLATYLKAIEAGVDVVDVALGSMSGLTAQPNFNTLMEILKGTERAPDFNIPSLNDFSNYWEVVREYYYPFESGLKAGTADVYQHEIPGGQYSNLRPQATSLGLGDRMPEIKATYAEVNKLFGNIVKVTPSSKVVGDLTLYMVANGYSAKDVLEKGKDIDFPQSTRAFFRGELGQPYQGFPEKLQKLVLKDERPMTERANAQLTPVDFEAELATFEEAFPHSDGFLDFLSYKLYPKVYEQYYNHKLVYGEVWYIPTLPFFFGLKEGEEVIVEIDKGKKILVKLLHKTEPNEAGLRNVHFLLNGHIRTLEVKDTSIKVEEKVHVKASENDENEIGAPLQGLLSKIFVKVGDAVKKNTPLFVIEAMKMETTITATKSAKVTHLELKEGTMVDANDLVLKLEG